VRSASSPRIRLSSDLQSTESTPPERGSTAAVARCPLRSNRDEVVHGLTEAQKPSNFIGPRKTACSPIRVLRRKLEAATAGSLGPRATSNPRLFDPRGIGSGRL